MIGAIEVAVLSTPAARKAFCSVAVWLETPGDHRRAKSKRVALTG
jgi:hypothetical protein